MQIEVHKYEDVRDKILSGINKIEKPVIGTLTPKGRNVIYDTGFGYGVTNDGKTIVQQITSEDPVEDAIINIIKQASLKTDQVAGDGTTTAILLAARLVRGGFKLIDEGWNPMELKRELDVVSKLLTDEIEARSVKITTEDEDKLFYIARTSSNNDTKIAKNIVDVVKRSGTDGMVFLERNYKSEVEIIGEDGFYMESGMFDARLSNQRGRFSALYQDVPVFITDSRLYYEKECVAILDAVHKMNYNKVVIVARDFIGQAPNIFISNHMNQKVNFEILLVKDTSLIKSGISETLDDLATYLGTTVYSSDKLGSISVEKLKVENFGIAKRVFADGTKSIFTPKDQDKYKVMVDLRVKAIKDMLEDEQKEAERKNLEKRLASLTSGVTTMRIGATTEPELNELMHRYTDALSATRNALKEGYVIGGGLTLFNSFKQIKYQFPDLNQDIVSLMKKLCEASIYQIAENCNEPIKNILPQITEEIGYNAVTSKCESLLEAGIIEPTIVTRMATQSAISVAQMILSSNFIIAYNKEEKTEE